MSIGCINVRNGQVIPAPCLCDVVNIVGRSPQQPVHGDTHGLILSLRCLDLSRPIETTMRHGRRSHSKLGSTTPRPVSLIRPAFPWPPRPWHGTHNVASTHL